MDELVWSHSVPDDGTGINALEPLAARIYPERGLLLAAANASGLCSYWFPVRDGQWQPPKSLRLLPFPFGPGNRLPLRNVRIVMYDLPGEKTDMERGMIAVEVPLFDPVSPATYWFNFCFDQEADAPFFAQLGRGVSIE